MSAPAYVIVRTRSNPGSEEAMAAYRAAASPATEAHQGEYLARGGTMVHLEGSEDPRRTVILKFPSLELATAWYQSDAYTAAKALREGHADFDMFIIEGQEP